MNLDEATADSKDEYSGKHLTQYNDLTKAQIARGWTALHCSGNLREIWRDSSAALTVMCIKTSLTLLSPRHESFESRTLTL